MAIQFLAKAVSWTPGTSKKLKIPVVLITVTYDDSIFVKMPADKRKVFDIALDKSYDAKHKDTLKMMGAKMRTAISSADAAIEKGGDAPASALKVQKELAEVARDIERFLTSASAAAVSQTYKTVMNGVVLVGNPDAKTQTQVQGKVAPGEGSAVNSSAPDLAELAPKVLSGFVYPIQDEVEGVTADSKAAAGFLDKAMKEANLLSKAMREQAKKPVPANAALIKTTSTTLHKSLETIERLAVGSQSKLRQIKAKITSLAQQTKEWKHAEINTLVNACTSDAQDISELVGTAPTLKPFADQLAKPFDGKTIPDFGKLLTLLNRLRDPRPSAQLEGHVGKLGDVIAHAASA
jgi:hypothetical protein